MSSSMERLTVVTVPTIWTSSSLPGTPGDPHDPSMAPALPHIVTTTDNTTTTTTTNTEQESAWRTRTSGKESRASQMSDGYHTSLSPTKLLGATLDMTLSRPTSDAGRASTRRPSRPSIMLTPAPGMPAEDIQWDGSERNPRNWSRLKRWYHSVVAASVAFTIAFATSTAAPIISHFEDRYDIPTVYAALPLALFILGIAFGPFVSAFISNAFGRKFVYMTCFPLFSVFVLAGGFLGYSHASIDACRFLAGFFAGPALSVGYNTITDVWALDENSIPFMVHNCLLYVGSTIGLVVASPLLSYGGWPWTQWVVCFAAAICVILIVPMSDTSRKMIEHRQTGGSFLAPLDHGILASAIARPLHMLVAEPIITLYGVYVGFNFAVMYAAFVSWPTVFAECYGFYLDSHGVAFAGMAIGNLVALGLLALHQIFVHERRVDEWKTSGAVEIERSLITRRQASVVSPLDSLLGDSPTDRRPSVLSHNGDSPRDGAGLSPGTLEKAALAVKRENGPSRTSRERNLDVAGAASKYLSSVPENEGMAVSTEHILQLLYTNPTFGDFCDLLGEEQFTFDRVHLAMRLVEAVEGRPPTSPVDMDKEIDVPHRPLGIIRSKSMHRTAAEAALDPPPPAPYLPAPNFLNSAAQRPSAPPAEWHLTLALPASILVPGGLFMFGWSARPDIHWIVPVVGMGIFGVGNLLVFTSATSYLLDVYGPGNHMSALGGSMVVRYLLSFVFALFALRAYRNIGNAWATSIFAFICLALGLVPWILLKWGPKWRASSKYASQH